MITPAELVAMSFGTSSMHSGAVTCDFNWCQLWTRNVPTAETYDANQDVFRASVDDFSAVVAIAFPGDVRVMGTRTLNTVAAAQRAPRNTRLLIPSTVALPIPDRRQESPILHNDVPIGTAAPHIWHINLRQGNLLRIDSKS
jgi:hypothetical protein